MMQGPSSTLFVAVNALPFTQYNLVMCTKQRPSVFVACLWFYSYFWKSEFFLIRLFQLSQPVYDTNATYLLSFANQCKNDAKTFLHIICCCHCTAIYKGEILSQCNPFMKCAQGDALLSCSMHWIFISRYMIFFRLSQLIQHVRVIQTIQKTDFKHIY